MSKDTAVVVAAAGSPVNVTITTGAIEKVAWQPPAPPAAKAPSSNGQIVTVPSLPAGDSSVRVDLSWAPGDGDAEVQYPVGTVVDKIYRHSQAGTVYILLLFGT
jgi:hypothetical protein